MGRTATFTPEMKAEALWMLDSEQFSQTEICERIGCSNASLYTWRKMRDGNELVLPENWKPSAALQLQLQRRQAEAHGGILPSENGNTDAGTAEQQTLDGAGDPTPASSDEPAPAPPDEPVEPVSALPVPAPMPTNGGAVERAASVELGELVPVSLFVAELGTLREQLAEAQRRAERSDAALAQANLTIAQMRADANGLEQVAAEELAHERGQLARERDKARSFRTTMRYLMEDEK